MEILLATSVKGIEEELRNRLDSSIQVIRTKSDEETAAAMVGAEVIFGDPGLIGPHLDKATELKWVQSTYAGVDALLSVTSRTDFLLSRVKGIFGPLIAEYVIGHILKIERHMLSQAEAQERHKWIFQRYRRLSELTLGILGAGDIGGEVARAAKTFGMTVHGLRSEAIAAPYVDKVFGSDAITEFLASPDYLVNLLPSTPQTRGILNGGILQYCGKNTIFINVGRGDVIDEVQLVKAINNEWIKGAVLDVFQEEPLPESSPLWALPNVTITPHVSALGFARNIVDIFLRNLDHYQSGSQLECLVNWEAGY